MKLNDFELIMELLKNSKVSFSDLAKKYNVTEGAIRNRIKNLENRGVISNYTVNVNFNKLGIIGALIGFDVEPDKYLSIVDTIKHFKNVIEIWQTGGDHMYMMLCVFKDHNEISNFVKKIEKISGITRVCPALLVNKIV